ncbi:hypothetical protein AHAS_Ahas05G0052800 [Arachis hypogaea]
MRMFGSRGLVSLVVQRCVEEGIHRLMVVVVDNQKSAHHSHYLDMLLGMALGHSMLAEVVPRGLIKSLWLLQSLIVPTLMPVPIIASIPHNNIGTKLIATEVRIHSS